MSPPYAYTAAIWPPLAAALLVAAIGLYSWRRRDVPGAAPLAAGSLFVVGYFVAMAIETAATELGVKIAWHNFEVAMQLPAATAATCFVLEYTHPGRWLTRRNIVLLSLPPLLLMLLALVDPFRFLWVSLEVGPSGTLVAQPAAIAKIGLAYGVALGLVNAAALLWLFVRSPQHRWPAALMLFAQMTARGTRVLDAAGLPALAAVDPEMAAGLISWATYAIALFGFRIFDPLPAARAMVLQQMHAGVAVFDRNWRVISLNLAAERMLGMRDRTARGKSWEHLMASSSLTAVAGARELLTLSEANAGEAEMADLVVSAGNDARPGVAARCYAPTLSELRDFRGLVLGYLLMLRDVTEQRRAQVQIVQQQRSLAVLQERERLARELHDSLGQVLAATHVQAATASLLLGQGQVTQADQCMRRLADTTLEAEADVRDYLLGAKTIMSPDRPFFAALREYLVHFGEQHDLPIQLTVPPELEVQGLPQAAEVQLQRIIQEALSNVRKHSGAAGGQVIFTVDGGSQVRVVIADDGCGFEPAARVAGVHYGLAAMRDRAEALGGSLEVISGVGRGTQVVVEVPLEA